MIYASGKVCTVKFEGTDTINDIAAVTKLTSEELISIISKINENPEGSWQICDEYENVTKFAEEVYSEETYEMVYDLDKYCLVVGEGRLRVIKNNNERVEVAIRRNG